MPMRTARLVVSALVALSVAPACSGPDEAPTEPATPVPGRAAPPPSSPQPSARAAVEALLEAERRGDRVTSFRLLSREARKEYGDPSAWSRRRSELPAVTGFWTERVDGGTVVVIVEHAPALDPFVGLSPARERQTWTAHPEDGGWLLDGDPATEVLLPSEDTARGAVAAWIDARRRCDAEGTRALQAATPIHGTSAAPDRLCRAPADVAVGAVVRLPAGPSTQSLVNQYGPDALTWGRAVEVKHAAASFHVVLAPWGETWKVVGVLEP